MVVDQKKIKTYCKQVASKFKRTPKNVKIASIYYCFVTIVLRNTFKFVIYRVVNHSSIIFYTCLLYTSDAADDTPCVDLGGRRIIKKNEIRVNKNNFKPELVSL